MLSCKQVATIASDYLDKSTPLKWQIRLHLLMCANCRRFVRHMKITRELSKQMVLNKTADDVDTIWNKVQQQIKQDSQSD
ncbi:zf-HC2 domain-containing protein [Cellvibrio fibrivorans]|jgi:hypothetical protein|uniref:Zinc-finger domain-containing protein n=1 Tax=Cellvibrio fibrivorans TaxID=126350 RepID=A0ABU1UW75_9GAMM|nr:hypothetical protein [Cellvibrio fibrivorans]MDR7089423.1 hypothetical protein [Cellvibrio fibrivorans]